MKYLAQLVLIVALCFLFSENTNAQANTTGYYPLKIKNRAGGSSNVSKVYFIMTGQMWNTQATNAVLRFTWSADSSGYIGHLDPVTATTNSSAYSYRIDTMPGYNAADSTLLLYIPHLQSGRCMVSLNYMMQFPPVTGSNGVVSLQEPNINNPGDANSGILFDKFEFSYDTTGASGTLYIDPTAVDFFAIPITISLAGETSGAPLGAKRDKLMNTMRATLTKYDQTTNHIWDSLAMRDASKTTVLRLAAPYLAPGFDLSYLSNANQYAINYIDTLCTYYIKTNNPVLINCGELNQTGFEVFDIYNQTPAQNPGAYIFTGTMINT
ncbi:MAG: beta-1,3-glucanase family protein, partial [Bacteroidia bacterium]